MSEWANHLNMIEWASDLNMIEWVSEWSEHEWASGHELMSEWSKPSHGVSEWRYTEHITPSVWQVCNITVHMLAVPAHYIIRSLQLTICFSILNLWDMCLGLLDSNCTKSCTSTQAYSVSHQANWFLYYAWVHSGLSQLTQLHLSCYPSLCRLTSVSIGNQYQCFCLRGYCGRGVEAWW